MVLKDNALDAFQEFYNFVRRFSEQVDFKYYLRKVWGSGS